MTRQLQKGENISLANVNELIVGMKWIKKANSQTEIENINSGAFMLNSDNKITQKSDFIFHTQPISTNNAIIFKNHLFKVTLNQIPESIIKVSCIVAFNQLLEQQNFGLFKVVIKIFDFYNKQELLSFTLEDATVETALIMGYLYRHQQQWKFKAIGQGYASGLKTLANNFGMSLDSPVKPKNTILLNKIRLINLSEKHIRSIASEAIFESARAYYQHDKIVNFEYDDKNFTINSQVKDNQDIYSLLINEKNNDLQIESNCNCKIFPCEHHVAVLLTYLHHKEENNTIEVTGHGQEINQAVAENKTTPENNSSKAPFWEHQYVYSYSAINNASTEQLGFYHYFKNQILDKNYVDLEGNLNYAFILLFDFVQEYNNHKNFEVIESQLTRLWQYYLKTKTYCISELEKIKNGNGSLQYSNPFALGDCYREKLGLTNEQVKLLNRMYYCKNKFSEIDQCLAGMIKVFLIAVCQLEKIYLAQDQSFESYFVYLLDLIARKEYKYRKNSSNYQGLLNQSVIHYHIIFKQCENNLRDLYCYGKKINVNIEYRNNEIQEEFNCLILKVNEIFNSNLNAIKIPDTETEIKLNGLNKSRWRVKFEKLVAEFKPTEKTLFINDVKTLAELNKNNPTIKNLFLDAFKFIKAQCKESALIFYCYYVYYHYNSSETAHKSLTKAEQKLLFATSQQQEKFDKTISNLIENRNIEQALLETNSLYKIERKTIQLNRESIKQVHENYINTVNLLNTYLQDDVEQVVTDDGMQNVASNLLHKDTLSQSILVSNIGLNVHQLEILKIFATNSYTVSQTEIEKIAKEKSLFKNQLIDSINEICYEHLDDILIEEENDYYVINETYYQRIIEAC
jgi:stress response protein SCP2